MDFFVDLCCRSKDMFDWGSSKILQAVKPCYKRQGYYNNVGMHLDYLIFPIGSAPFVGLA